MRAPIRHLAGVSVLARQLIAEVGPGWRSALLRVVPLAAALVGRRLGLGPRSLLLFAAGRLLGSTEPGRRAKPPDESLIGLVAASAYRSARSALAGRGRWGLLPRRD